MSTTTAAVGIPDVKGRSLRLALGSYLALAGRIFYAAIFVMSGPKARAFASNKLDFRRISPDY